MYTPELLELRPNWGSHQVLMVFPQTEHFITSPFSLFPLVTKITICPLFILHPVNSRFGVRHMQTGRKSTAPQTPLIQWSWGQVDYHAYLQEERHNRYKCVGAAGEQGEGSATVHPQRVVSWGGNQSVQRTLKQRSMSPPAVQIWKRSDIVALS